MSAPNDPVNRPAHYTRGSVEAIDFIRQTLGTEGFVAYCAGNAMKYLSRAGHKDGMGQDLAKAAWYCQMAAHAVEPARFNDPRGTA